MLFMEGYVCISTVSSIMWRLASFYEFTVYTAFQYYNVRFLISWKFYRIGTYSLKFQLSF